MLEIGEKGSVFEFELGVKRDLETQYLRLRRRYSSESPNRRRDMGKNSAGHSEVWVRSRSELWMYIFVYVHTTGLEKRECWTGRARK